MDIRENAPDVVRRERLAKVILLLRKRRRRPVKRQAFALAWAANGVIASSRKASLQDRSSWPLARLRKPEANTLHRDSPARWRPVSLFVAQLLFADERPDHTIVHTEILLGEFPPAHVR